MAITPLGYMSGTFSLRSVGDVHGWSLHMYTVVIMEGRSWKKFRGMDN